MALKLSDEAQKVLAARYLAKDDRGDPLEDAEAMFRQASPDRPAIARNPASARRGQEVLRPAYSPLCPHVNRLPRATGPRS